MHDIKSSYGKLHRAQRHIRGLWDAAETLKWDRDTLMPADVAYSRAMQMEALTVAQHASETDPRLGDIIAAAAADATLDDHQRRNVDLCRHNYEMATLLSEDLVARQSRTANTSLLAWGDAKDSNDWTAWLPAFTEVIDVAREIAQAQADKIGATPYDACLDKYEAGNRLADIKPLFSDLELFLQNLMPLVQERQAGEPALPPLPKDIPTERQHALCMIVMDKLGFNLKRGRLDISAHPFSSEMTGDARITTRYDESDFTGSLYSLVHETGHAIYSQNGMGTQPEWYGQPVARELGMLIHESQSLLFEKQLGMSDAFIEWVAPVAATVFSLEGSAITAAQLRQHLRHVTPSFIRTEADEVTYPLHIMLRTDIESQLINGDIEARHLRDAWNSGFEAKFGIAVPDDRRGCLQDVHWPEGLVGYFPCYTQGAIVAAALMNSARANLPTLDADAANGNFKPLVTWLNKNVHSQGSRYTAPELIERVTGQPLSVEPFKAHLQRRYLG